LPSESDRRAWLPLSFIMGLLLILSLLFGAGPWLALHLSDPLNQILLAVDLVLGVSVLVHLILLPPLWLVRYLLSRLLRLRVVL
jgi:hypothetical protein